MSTADPYKIGSSQVIYGDVISGQERPLAAEIENLP